MVNMANSDSDFCEQISHKCSDYASEILKFSSFKDLQTKAILSALIGRDVFVNLPTGYGKSGIFEAIPLCYDYLRNEEAGGTPSLTEGTPGATGRQSGVRPSLQQSIEVIISPLVSLMKSQVGTN